MQPAGPDQCEVEPAGYHREHDDERAEPRAEARRFSSASLPGRRQLPNGHHIVHPSRPAPPALTPAVRAPGKAPPAASAAASVPDRFPHIRRCRGSSSASASTTSGRSVARPCPFTVTVQPGEGVIDEPPEYGRSNRGPSPRRRPHGARRSFPIASIACRARSSSIASGGLDRIRKLVEHVFAHSGLLRFPGDHSTERPARALIPINVDGRILPQDRGQKHGISAKGIFHDDRDDRRPSSSTISSAKTSPSSAARIPPLGGNGATSLAAKGIKVPPGFATTSDAFRRFIIDNDLTSVLDDRLGELTAGKKTLAETGRAISRGHSPLATGPPMSRSISAGPTANSRSAPASRTSRSPCVPRPPRKTCPTRASRASRKPISTSEGEDELLAACRNCYASLFTDGRSAYRATKGFVSPRVRLSPVGVAEWLRSDTGGWGVMFIIDTRVGLRTGGCSSTAAWGSRRRTLVQGAVRHHEFPGLTKPFYSPISTPPPCKPIVGRTLD